MQAFFTRPHYTRRHFFQIAGGVTASFLASQHGPAQVTTAASVTTQNKARNVIFILLAGAPSHTDTFDLKEVPGVTPPELEPATIHGIRWPAGIMPKLGQQIPEMAIVRSMRAWALVHSLAQTWTQIGRNPTAALGSIAPNIGSIVAIEREKERAPSQIFPTFLALNSDGAAGRGYLPAIYAPFKLIPSPGGIPNTTNPDGPARFHDRWNLLNELDAPLRANSPLGDKPEDYESFYEAARGLMYHPAVDSAFKISGEDSARYGGTAFGNACLVAKQVLAANQGTRFIQITLCGWDMHENIYARLPGLCRTLDDGLATLLKELKSSGLLQETLVVAVGEFGRTVGRLSWLNGRDHDLQQSCIFAGAGIKGGRAIGATDEAGGASAEYGWARERDIRVEDVEATIYSALGINWTTVRYDDPFGRGFEYVPFSSQDLYGPVNELWS